MTLDEDIPTRLPDLCDVPLAELRRRADLNPFRDILVAQVERARINLGTGPPGRAD